MPTNSDTIIIDNGDAVILNQTDNLPGNSIITLSNGSSIAPNADSNNVLRMNGSTITVESGATLISSNFWDWNNATATFYDGVNTDIANWENKGTNTFNFILGATGFKTLNNNTGTFRFGSGFDFTDSTYTVDMASYTGGAGTIVLADFALDGANNADTTLTNAGSIDIKNAGAFTGSFIRWVDATDTIELVVAVPEPSTYALLSGCLALSALAMRRRK